MMKNMKEKCRLNYKKNVYKKKEPSNKFFGLFKRKRCSNSPRVVLTKIWKVGNVLTFRDP